jgi:hypothetical protein
VRRDKTFGPEIGRLLLACGCLFAAGCSTPTQSPPDSSRIGALAPETKTVAERGPLRVTVAVAPAPARLSDELQLVLTLDYEIGVEVKSPPFADAVGDFLVRDFHESLPEIKDNRQIVRQTYTLESMRTGAAHIDPIVVSFTDKRTDKETADGKLHHLETEALKVEILSVVGKDIPSLKDLKGFAGPMALPSEKFSAKAWILGSAILLAVAASVVWFVRRRRAATPQIVLSPREQAVGELDELWRSDYARVDVKRFYVELTAIVRRYIERTTGIHAPEQTTEEFLHEVGSGKVFSPDDRQRLKDFLESADLVKFAGYQPNFPDVEQSYHRAYKFVDQPQEIAPA